MKKILLLLSLIISISAFAQDEAAVDSTEGWTSKGTLSLNISQSSFTNWAGGGDNSLAGNILFGGIANYKMGKSLWENTLLTTYGSIRKAGDFTKTDDRIELNSKYGYQAFKNPKFFLSAIMNFKTQYTEGFANDTLLVSSFMSPGYLNLGLGIDWKAAEYFSLNFAPIDAKMIFVMDQFLADRGDYGVDPAVLDTNGNVLTPGKNMKFKFGAYLRAQFNKEIFKNVTLYTTLDLFSNYLENPQNIDVNWEVLISMKINEWLAASINTTLIYDADVVFERTDENGISERYGPRTQFKEVFNLGLTFNFK